MMVMSAETNQAATKKGGILMTQNVNVAISNMETARANRVKELETQRHNTAVEWETFRSNIAKEAHNRNVLAEEARHARATEHQARADLSERTRAAKATESIRSSELAEARRHNVMQEVITSSYNRGQLAARREERQETHRHNVRNELLADRGHDIQERNVYGNLTLQQQRIENDFLLGTEQNRIRERDVYFQHADRLGNLQVSSYNAMTDRINTFLRPLTMLLGGAYEKKSKW